MHLLLVFQLWASHISAHDRAVGRFSGTRLWGNWQSCRDDEGNYEERAVEYRINGALAWTLHMGPHHEFALYRGLGVTGEHTHNSPLNLLGLAYDYDAFKTKVGGRTWRVESLKLLINVIAAGGSRDECESFEVKVEDIKP